MLVSVLLYRSQFGDGNASGGGLHVHRGLVKFKGAASFIDNEVLESFQRGEGAGMYSTARHDEPMVFSGPVLFRGNLGTVSEDSLYKHTHLSEVYADVSFLLLTTVDMAPQNRPLQAVWAALLRRSTRAPYAPKR